MAAACLLWPRLRFTWKVLTHWEPPGALRSAQPPPPPPGSALGRGQCLPPPSSPPPLLGTPQSSPNPSRASGNVFLLHGGGRRAPGGRRAGMRCKGCANVHSDAVAAHQSEGGARAEETNRERAVLGCTKTGPILLPLHSTRPPARGAGGPGPAKIRRGRCRMKSVDGSERGGDEVQRWQEGGPRWGWGRELERTWSNGEGASPRTGRGNDAVQSGRIEFGGVSGPTPDEISAVRGFGTNCWPGGLLKSSAQGAAPGAWGRAGGTQGRGPAPRRAGRGGGGAGRRGSIRRSSTSAHTRLYWGREGQVYH